MKNFLKNITFIFVSYNSKKILKKSLKKLPTNSKIIIIENSNDTKIKKSYQRYKNINVILNPKNNGFGGGNNIGLELTKTPYALLISPDVFLKKKIFTKLKLAIKEIKNNFWLIGLDNIKNQKDSLEQVSYINGHAIFVNIKKFKNKKIFDENYFLYNEELDLCKNVEKNKGKIFLLNTKDIKHLGKMSSGKDNFKMQVFRNWHGCWSYIYFYKKNYGLYKMYIIFFKKFLNFFCNYLLAIIFLKKNKMILNKFKTLALISALLGRPSYLRLKNLKF